MGKKIKQKILVGKPQGMKPLGTHIHRWVDNFSLVLHIQNGSGLCNRCNFSFKFLNILANLSSLPICIQNVLGLNLDPSD
jgi:hypothetical protein